MCSLTSLIFSSLPPLFAVMCGSSFTKDLQETRERLSNEITELVTEMGPQLFPDLDTNIMVLRDDDLASPIPSGALTPNTFSALNWFMTPFELVSERLFSDTEGDSSASVSRSSSHPNLHSLMSGSDLKINPPSSKQSPVPQPLEPTMDLGESMVMVQPPTPTDETSSESKKAK